MYQCTSHCLELYGSSEKSGEKDGGQTENHRKPIFSQGRAEDEAARGSTGLKGAAHGEIEEEGVWMAFGLIGSLLVNDVDIFQ